jgi:hypothetical protein
MMAYSLWHTTSLYWRLREKETHNFITCAEQLYSITYPTLLLLYAYTGESRIGIKCNYIEKNEREKHLSPGAVYSAGTRRLFELNLIEHKEVKVDLDRLLLHCKRSPLH